MSRCLIHCLVFVGDILTVLSACRSNLNEALVHKDDAVKSAAEAGKSAVVLRERCVSESHTASPDRVSHEGDSCLPPTLSYLVLLWEELCKSTLKKVAENDIVMTCDKTRDDDDDVVGKVTVNKCKDEPSAAAAAAALRGNLFGRAADAGSVDGAGGSGVLCELCASEFSHPVTYHMRLAHPGCGRPAGGHGYNSGGSFCGGWAGSCGEGGFGGSTWYLMCDACRTHYLHEKKRAGSRHEDRRRKPVMLRKKAGPAASAAGPSQPHWVIYNNAMFVLELAGGVTDRQSAGGTCGLSAVTEDTRAPVPVNDSMFPRVPFLYLQLHGATSSDESVFTDSDDVRYFRTGQSTVSGGVLDRSVSDSCHRPVSTYHAVTDDAVSKATLFQRSVSEMASIGHVAGRGAGTDHGGECWSRQASESGSLLVRRPSTDMARLIQSLESVDDITGHMSRLPLMMFLTERHDLDLLRRMLVQAVRRAACRTFGLDAVNWLLRSTSQWNCLHDLLWHYITAVSSRSSSCPADDDTDHDVAVCDHPVSDVTVAGEVMTRPLISACHSLLQSIADMLMCVSPGSAVQRMAVRCWSMQFHAADHAFLHRSHVFSHMSSILSRADDEARVKDVTATHRDVSVVEQLTDVTSDVEIKTSSRQAMVAGLTDGSTETFWESGDEDRNKTRWMTLNCAGLATDWRLAVVSVHVDNGRDIGSKVSSVTIQAGLTADSVEQVRHVDLDQRHAGWVSAWLANSSASFVRLELRGTDNTLRVRQLKLLAESRDHGRRSRGQCDVIEQRQCENETLSVFRLLTSLVFGGLVSAGDADLKEHMVGILFSHVTQLTRLQRQVCAHIVDSVRVEAARVRTHWLSQPPPPPADVSDAYCFELLSLLLALSGSSVGRRYVAQQTGLLEELTSMLHTASARVQRQVVSLLRRTLSDISPRSFAALLGIDDAPPSNLAGLLTTGSVHRRGLLDVLLACIAKALSVQVKSRLPGSVSRAAFVSLADCGMSVDEECWWLRGSVPTQLAESIIRLLVEMTDGQLGSEWAAVTKCAIADPIVRLSQLSTASRTADVCLESPVIWLALAALCVLHVDHVQLLSTGRWAHAPSASAPSPTCDNHDDGETPATILCGSGCGSLCSDCDRVLHLSKRHRLHQRQVVFTFISP